MDVPTHDTIGLQIYRELIGRETRSVGTWEQTFGREVCAACIRSCHNACTLLSPLLTPPHHVAGAHKEERSGCHGQPLQL